jgi:hypothetical protein
MGAAAAVMIRKEKELVAHFRQAGATSPATAKSLSALRIDGEPFALRRLRRHAVIREGATGAWYVDEPSWEALRSSRRRMALLLLFLAAMIGVAAFYASTRAGR